MNMNELTRVLTDLQLDSENELFSVVIEELLNEEFETVEEVTEYLTSIVIGGTKTGIVPRLIYRNNIRNLFFEFSEDVINIALHREVKLNDFINFDEFVDTVVRVAYKSEAYALVEFIKHELPQAN